MKTLKKILTLLFTVLAIIQPIINYTFRIGYIFIDHEVFDGFSRLLFCIMILNSIYALAYILAWKNRKAPIIATCFFIFCCILSLVFTLVNAVSSSIAHAETMYMYLGKMLPYLAVGVVLPFLLFVFPSLGKKAKAIAAAVLLSAFIIAVVSPEGFTYNFRFLSDPLVLDAGEDIAGQDNYSVVWATNTLSWGCVKYNYGGEDYEVYSNDRGDKAVGRIHAALIPREHLEDNSYTVQSVRIKDWLSYGGRVGRTIQSREFKFRGSRDIEDLRMLAVSDWHGQVELLKKASVAYKDLDLVLMAGDYADFLISERAVIDNIIAAGAALTGGEIPAIFVRGNHETRGENGAAIRAHTLGLTDFYYRVERGGYVFTVLDCGEDHADDYWEFKDFNDFRAYHAKQIEWMSQQAFDVSKYNIVLVHAADLCPLPAENHPEYSVYLGYRNAYFEWLKSGADMTVSGHSHNLVYWKEYGCHRFMDGGGGSTSMVSGLLGNLFPKTYHYTASLITFKGDTVTFSARNADGEAVDIRDYDGQALNKKL